MNTWAQTFFTGWHFMRWFRLAIGIYAVGQAILMHDSMIGFLGAFFLFQAVTNTGCCGTQACAAPNAKRKTEAEETIQFEEIKTQSK
jgi:hypothetical protein